MAEQPTSGPLDAETLAAYLDGRLSPAERAVVEAEVAAHADLYEWLVSTMRRARTARLASWPRSISCPHRT
mgnify:CR=1 FL=1